MADVAVVPVAPEAPKVEVPAEAPKEDLITRVAKFTPEAPKAEAPKEESFFDIKEIDKISDLRAKEIAEKAYKSMQSDYTRKTQTLAEQRKAAEDIKKQYEELSKVNANWTPERIQGLLNDPNFVKAASQVAGTQPSSNPSELTTEEWSALSDKEKKFLAEVKSRQEQTESYIKNLQAQQFQVSKSHEDQTLKGKYPNYNPEAVDIITNDLLQGKVRATREDLWKVKDYETAVERAYQLGLQDAKVKVQEKVQSMAYGANNTVQSSSDAPPPIQGESNMAYFKRIAQANLAKLAAKK